MFIRDADLFYPEALYHLVIEPDMVFLFAAEGHSEEEIALYFNMTMAEWRAEIEAEGYERIPFALKRGRAVYYNMIRGAVVDSAKKGVPEMIKFLAKNDLGMEDRKVEEKNVNLGVGGLPALQERFAEIIEAERGGREGSDPRLMPPGSVLLDGKCTVGDAVVSDGAGKEKKVRSRAVRPD